MTLHTQRPAATSPDTNHPPLQHTLQSFPVKHGLYILCLSRRSLTRSNDETEEHHQHTVTAKIINPRKTTISQYFRACKHRPKALATTLTGNTTAKIPTPTIVAPTRPNPAPRVRGYNTDRIAHRARYPHHLPDVPVHIRERTRDACYWHLRMHHINSHTLRTMAKLPLQNGLPGILRHTHTYPLMHCHGCTTTHLHRAAHHHTTHCPGCT